MSSVTSTDIGAIFDREIAAATKRGEQIGRQDCLAALRSSIETIVEQFNLEIAQAAHRATLQLRSALEGSNPYLELAEDPTPIEDIGLTTRTYNCLKREGIHTVGEMAQKPREELSDIRNLGNRGVVEIVSKLAELWDRKNYPAKVDTSKGTGGPEEVNVDLDAVAAAAKVLSANKTSARAAIKSDDKSSTQKGRSYKHSDGVRAAADIPVEAFLAPTVAAGLRGAKVANLAELRALTKKPEWRTMHIDNVGAARKANVLAKMERFIHVK